ncbi:50S ribosomal protein L35ae [Candidatus Woesearchaeota archaeon]|nr:50S ribosomal protein L35ae [Candidatus Woesearchaeota archaeon]
MKGIINNFRMHRHTQYKNHMIIVVKNVDNREKATKLVGKSVTWKSPAGKEIKGEIKSAHGNKGALRAIFEKGMPGQSVHKEVEIK